MPRLAPLPLRTVLALIGFTAVVAQIVLMRELMVVFYGNEISLGVMLASWLLWTALGSNLLGKWSTRAHDPGRMMAALQVILALVFPATVLAVRASRSVLRATPGEILGPVAMLLTCLLTLSCFCAVSGCLFAAGSRLYAQRETSSSPVATSRVYLLEAVGSALGGILASLALIRYLNSIQVALLVSCLNLVAAASLTIRTVLQRRAAIAALLSIFVLGGPRVSQRLEAISLARLWPGFRLVATRNSVYGNLAAVETPGSRSLFENGLLMFNAPDPAAAEEAVHFALLQHPAPKSLLLIGGGASGSLLQALQHPSLERVDYVELDPAVLDLAQEYFPQQWAAAHADPRVFVHHADGRLFLKSTDRKFDVILVNLPDPQTAQLNRFYTLEFFREAAEKLNPGGVFSFQLHAAEEYISPELGDFLRCINKTLRQVFPVVTAIPGESVHFFAALQAGTLTENPQELISRLRSRHIQTRYVREYYIPFRMMPDRMLDLAQQIEPRGDTPLNRDFTPIAYYFDVALWSTQFNQSYRRVFQFIARADFTHVVAGIAMLLLVLGAVLRWLPHPARVRASAAFCTAATGFTLIGLEVLLLLGFQAVYGYVYHQLAIVIAFFMVGMALGSWWSLRRVHASQLNREMLTLAGLQFVAAASPLVLYLLFVPLSGTRSPISLTLVSQVLFPVLALLSGLLGGYQFPFASEVFFAGSNAAGLGTLYAVDLLGACLGALAVSALLLPVFGFLRSAILIAAVNLVPGLLAGWLAFAKAAPQE
ncbi:MAG TPA: fused MFS/spermidine synthase [Terriglobales bacterium]|jgi:spermidine synthase|nr:fused MFS/spermidine synthase [Terriglobales bacterium]